MISHNKVEYSVFIVKRFNNIIYGYHNYEKNGEKFSWPLKVVLHDSLSSTATKGDEVIIKGIQKVEPKTKQIIILADAIEVCSPEPN